MSRLLWTIRCGMFHRWHTIYMVPICPRRICLECGRMQELVLTVPGSGVSAISSLGNPPASAHRAGAWEV